MTDGGPAFPINANESADRCIYTGMTLRDWFAGMALQGMAPHIDDEVKAARWCYEMADIMLKERLK